VEFSYNDDSYLAAIDRYLYETDGTTLDPVASSSFSYTDGSLTGLVHTDPLEAILREYDWTYQAGRIVGETVDDDTRAFTYDADGQLKTVTAVPPGGSTSVETEFVYDATGNRDEIKEDNVQVVDYEVDAFNRVTCDGTYHYQYDPEGNRTAKFVDGTPANGVLDSGDTDWTVYTWDTRNRLIQVESGATFGTTDVTVTFGYDWLNRWISTDVDYAVGTDTAEYFVYGGATLPYAVTPWDRAAVDSRDVGQITLRLDETQKITNRYLWGPAVDQILADEQVEWNAGAQDYDIDQILWPLTDHQGTVRDLAAVNAISGDTEIVNTYRYNAYGILLAETAPAVDHLFGFTGRPSQTDAGLVNCLNRWYDPVIASWITQDPITFQGGDANLYRYCGNDPVNSVDPSGLYDGYWTEVGRTAKGYFWNGPVALASGVYNTIRHPIDTAKGIATAVRHPIQTGIAIKDEIVEKSQTSEGQGEIGFDVAVTVTPAGLAAKAKLAKAAKTAKGARAAEAAKAAEAARAAKAAKIASTAESVTDKLRRYLLNPNHPVGGDKATWFKKALGFTQENLGDLAKQIKFDQAKAVATELTQHGQKYEQVINIVGANGKTIPTLFVWIKNNDGVVRLVTSTLGID